MSNRPIDRALAWAADRGMNQSDVARSLRVSPQDVSNWKARGMPPEHLAAVAKMLGCSVDALLGLDGPLRADSPANTGYAVKLPISEWMMPTLITREHLMQKGAVLPLMFSATMPDDSMAPRIAQGTTIVFSTSATPTAGDGVLVQDREGNRYIRRYRQARGGNWEAHAVNEAWASLDAERDGLTVLAVVQGVMSTKL